MPQVLLNSNYFAGGVLYRKSQRGKPVEIPQKVIDAHGLPKDAKVVAGAAKLAPAAKPAQAPQEDVRSVEQVEADQLKKVNAEADAVVAAREEKKEASALDEDINTLLKGSVSSVVEELVSFGKEQLERMLVLERAGKNRSSLIVQIEAAIEDIVA